MPDFAGPLNASLPHPLPEDATRQEREHYRSALFDVIRYTLRTGDFQWLDRLFPNWTDNRNVSPITKYAAVCFYAAALPEHAELREQATSWLTAHGLRVPDPA